MLDYLRKNGWSFAKVPDGYFDPKATQRKEVFSEEAVTSLYCSLKYGEHYPKRIEGWWYQYRNLRGLEPEQDRTSYALELRELQGRLEISPISCTQKVFTVILRRQEEYL